jgi:hypothetical protein
MKRLTILSILIVVPLIVLLVLSCDNEKIVESTEYVHDIEYVQLPGDTVYLVDSVSTSDTVTIETTDTVYIGDTVVQTEYIYDTSFIYDTVETIQQYYDTTLITDTLVTFQCDPNEHFAVSAMQYYTNPLVIEFIYQEFGYDDGWVFYLSTYQLDLTQQSTDVYDMYGYIDYWTPDWSGYYALEFYWRLVHTGGDPSDPDNWEITEPAMAAGNLTPGLRLMSDRSEVRTPLR